MQYQQHPAVVPTTSVPFEFEPNSQHIQQRIMELERMMVQNALLISRLLTPKLAQGLIQPPKWDHLLHIESANIFVHDRKTMQLLGMTECCLQFVKQHCSSNFMSTFGKPEKLFPVIPPLLLMMHLNVMHSKAVSKWSFKICLPFLNIPLQVHMHFHDEYYWYEVVVTDWYDDAFAMDEYCSAATNPQVFPTATNPELAYQQYLKASNQRDCNMIAQFVQRNGNKFIVETSSLLQQVFAALAQ